MTKAAHRGNRAGAHTFAIALLCAAPSFILGAPVQGPDSLKASEERSEKSYYSGLRSFQLAQREQDEGEARRLFEEAATAFQEAADETEPYYMAGYYLGVALGKLDRYPEAIPHLEAARARLESIRARTGYARLGLGAIYQDLGVAYYESDRFDDALSALIEAERLDSENPLVHFYKGLCFYRLSNTNDALGALDKAVELDPPIRPRAEYYVGLSHLARDRLAQAADALRFTISAAADPEMKADAQAVLDRMIERRPEETEDGPKFWELRLTLGGEYDSNVILQAESGPTFGPITDQGDFGFSVAAGGGLIKRSETGYARVDYDFTQTLNVDISDFNIQSHLPRGEAGWRISPDFTLGVTGGGSFFRLGGEDYLRQYYVSPFARFFTHPRAYTDISYLFADQDFRGDFFEPSRDGTLHHIRARQYLLFEEADRYLYAGYSFVKEDPNSAAGAEYEYNGNAVEAGFQTGVPGDALFEIGYSFSNDDYANPNPLDPLNLPRNDDVHEIRVGFTKPLSPFLEFFAGYFGRFNNSNISAYQYRRHVGSFAFRFVF